MYRKFPVVLFLFLSGCITQVDVTFTCDPAGAKLVEDRTGQVFDCPTTLAYSVSPAQQNAGYMTADGMTAIWVSGAKTHLASLNVPLANGPNQQYRFVRDPSTPGDYMDEEFALQLENQATQQGFLATQQEAVYNQQAQLQLEQQQINQQNLNNAVAALARAIAQRRTE